MGIFSAISEGRFAAKMVQEQAKLLKVHPSSLPQWVIEAAKDNARAYKMGGYTPQGAAQLAVEQMGAQILRDMKEGS